MATPFLFSTLDHSTEAYSPTPKVCCAHSGDSIRDREFDSNVSYFLILIKACSILVACISLGSFVPFTPVGEEWKDEYAPFGPNSFNVHPTNS